MTAQSSAHLFLFTEVPMALSSVSMRRTFSFNTAGKDKVYLSDLVEDQRILRERFQRTEKLLNGGWVTCPACGGGCCQICSWEGAFWEEGIG